jgi:hypothetical protein
VPSSPLDRRTLLRGASRLAIGLPFLSAMTPIGGMRKARAAALAPRRFVVFYTPNGSNNLGEAGARGGETTFTLGQELAALTPFQKKLLVLSGVDAKTNSQNGGDRHSVGIAHMLTCIKAIGSNQSVGAGSHVGSWGGGISVDQEIARRVGDKTRLRSLELGVQASVPHGSNPFTRMVYLGPNKPVAPEDNPKTAFTRLVSSAGAGDAAEAARAIERIRAERKSVLDFVKDDYSRLSQKLGGPDRGALDAHISALREVERSLETSVSTVVAAGCKPPEAPASGDFARIGKEQMALLRYALACDVTRVASLQWSWARSNVRHSWAGVGGGHHDISHTVNATNDALMLKINRWYTEQLANLVGALDQVNEGERTLLDNTVVYYCSDVAQAKSHAVRSIRAVLVGSCGGHFKTGRKVTFNSEPHNRLMVNFLNAMGVETQTFGQSGYGTGPLPGLA